jgi:hypothetical protein
MRSFVLGIVCVVCVLAIGLGVPYAMSQSESFNPDQVGVVVRVDGMDAIVRDGDAYFTAKAVVPVSVGQSVHYDNEGSIAFPRWFIDKVVAP